MMAKNLTDLFMLGYMVHIFSKMLNRVLFSSWLTTLWSPNMFVSEVNVTLSFHGRNTNLLNTWQDVDFG